MADITADLQGFSNPEFRAGRALTKAFQIFARNAVPFSLIAGLVWLPIVGFDYVALAYPAAPRGLWTGAGWILYLLLQPISTAIILFAAFQDMRGRPVRLGESAERGLSRLLPLIALAVLQTLGIMLGVLLLIVPGIIVSMMWFVASPVCVVERVGPFQSLRRSRFLTGGHKWKIFGIYLLVLVVSVVVARLFMLGLATTTTPYVALAFYAAWQGATQAFASVFIVVIYHDLRVAKEGVDIEGIASVFD